MVSDPLVTPHWNHSFISERHFRTKQSTFRNRVIRWPPVPSRVPRTVSEPSEMDHSPMITQSSPNPLSDPPSNSQYDLVLTLWTYRIHLFSISSHEIIPHVLSSISLLWTEETLSPPLTSWSILIANNLANWFSMSSSLLPTAIKPTFFIFFVCVMVLIIHYWFPRNIYEAVLWISEASFITSRNLFQWLLFWLLHDLCFKIRSYL